MGKAGVMVSDFILSFMWVWSSVLIKMFVHKYLEMGQNDSTGEILKAVLSVLNMFFFSFLCKATRGGAYNPLTLLASAVSADFYGFIFVLGARIPSQVIGSIYGVRWILATFPAIGTGPRLNVEIHHGALTEGLLTYAIVMISLGLAKKHSGGFLIKTWIASVSKLALHILGSDMTGGCMNPASVMGWAYARGDHITKEHLLVYWLAPIKATLLAVFSFTFVVKPLTEPRPVVKAKPE